MNSKCYDQVALQAYLDGELPVLEMESTAAHLSACPDCRAAALELEAELFAIGQAFEPELTLPVPTAQLRARVNAAIAEMPADSIGSRPAGAGTVLDRLRTWAAGFTPRYAFGFAAAVLALVFAGWIAVTYLRAGSADPGSIVAVVNLTEGTGLPEWNVPEEPAEPVAAPITVNRPHYGRRPGAEPAPFRAARPAMLPGESAYLETIAQMDHSLKQQDALELRPTMQADIERNLAVLDQAILTSQDQARRNPKDPNAAAFLNAAYQNKIAFLRTVSDQAQLYAALR